MTDERIFILNWESHTVALIYAVYNTEGRVIVIDAFKIENDGSLLIDENEIERNAGKLRECLAYFEEKYSLKIQTLYLLFSGKGFIYNQIDDRRAYEKLLDSVHKGDFKNPKMPTPEMPLHCELFKVYEKYHPSSNQFPGYAFAVAASERDVMQKTFLEAECFIEGFIDWTSLFQTDINKVVIALNYDSSIIFAHVSGGVALYRENLFSLSSILEKICLENDVEIAKAKKMLQWTISPPSISDESFYKDEESSLFTSETFTKTREIISDELEHFFISQKQTLEDTGVWEQGLERLILIGEGAPLIMRYTFLYEIIKIHPQIVAPKYKDITHNKFDEQDYLPLSLALKPAYEHRKVLREQLERQNKNLSLKSWVRRILGR